MDIFGVRRIYTSFRVLKTAPDQNFGQRTPSCWGDFWKLEADGLHVLILEIRRFIEINYQVLNTSLSKKRWERFHYFVLRISQRWWCDGVMVQQNE